MNYFNTTGLYSALLVLICINATNYQINDVMTSTLFYFINKKLSSNVVILGRVWANLKKIRMLYFVASQIKNVILHYEKIAKESLQKSYIPRNILLNCENIVY